MTDKFKHERINRCSPLTIMYKKEMIYTMVVLNCKFPILLQFSIAKVTIPHSAFKSAAAFVYHKEFSVLGKISKGAGGIIYIKPFAMWEIITVK